jgi:hypothetical protein
MPQGRPHENWEEASCSCGESPPNCTVTLHKRVLADGDKWVEQKMVRRGRCVPCGAGVVPGMPEYPGAPGVEPTGGQRNICGPDITLPLQCTARKIRGMFTGAWHRPQRRKACEALSGIKMPSGPGGGYEFMWAWDIQELFHGAQNWHLSYYPPCSTPNGCEDTLEVSGQCFSIRSINYVAFGVMWRLCGDEFGEDEYRFGVMVNRVERWLMVTGGLSHVGAAKAWAVAGYLGWPDVAGGLANTPTGNRRNCQPTCTVRYGTKPTEGPTFLVHWGDYTF